MNEALAGDAAAVLSLTGSIARFLTDLDAIGPGVLRLEAASYPSAGLLRVDTEEARGCCQDIAASLAAMAEGVELCPLEVEDGTSRVTLPA